MCAATYIESEALEPIQVLALGGANQPLTGLTDIVFSVQRRDGKFLDFADMTFKSSGWTTAQQVMAEVSASLAPGQYSYVLDLSAITNGLARDIFVITATQTPGVSAINMPQLGELRVGELADDISLSRKVLTNQANLGPGDTGNYAVLDDDDETTLLTFDVTGPDGESIALSPRTPVRRSRGY